MGHVQDQGRQMLVVYAAAILAVALIGARYLHSTAAQRPAAASHISPGPSGASGRVGGELVIHVSGAVRRPGIVRLRDGDRVADAVDAAGGPRRGADVGAVNLAARLADGQQVVVPARPRGRSGADGATASAGAVSLATATLEELQTLDGIGPGLAQKIIDHRTQHGGFRSVDELAEVPGIGEKRLESLRAQLAP